MVATTNLALVPEEFHPTAKEKPTTDASSVEEDPIFKVFEKDNGWRSFRVSQIKVIYVRD